jgi:hypothetical protein
MKKYSGRAADPVDDTVLVSFDGSQLAAVANPSVWALAVRWGSTLVVGAPLLGHGTPIPALPVGTSQDEAVAEAA